MDAIDISIFSSRIDAICDEMGAVLRRTAFSPNIRDRMDFSCAIFDPNGELCAQAAHIPVHLGSMAFAMADIASQIQWNPGDTVVLNDPYLGGTHLPDVTAISCVFAGGNLVGFVVNRAHHADIGSDAPGSMPISTHIEEEGLVIPPTHLVREGMLDESFLQKITDATSNEQITRGDFAAQLSANRTGVDRLLGLVEEKGVEAYQKALRSVNEYGERLARSALSKIPQGCYEFQDLMESDGVGNKDIVIRVAITVKDSSITVDFNGTARQTQGNINCPLSVAAAGVFYVFRCLMPDETPACAGVFRSIEIQAPKGSLLNAQRPAAVAAGNVETSSRVVDVVLGALAHAIPEQIPAASQGTMNNLAMGSREGARPWDYYETIGGGMGASMSGDGLSAVQTHMTNTLNTPIEVLEMNMPLRVRRYAVRDHSGGDGKYRGGDGLIREFEFLASTQVTIISERRCHAPWGLNDGCDGKKGKNLYNGAEQSEKISLTANRGDRLTVATPGGGGWGFSMGHG